MAVTGRALERLLDVNIHEALPHRDVSTQKPHLPGATVVQYASAAADEIAHLRHLYTRRMRPELFDIDPDGNDAVVIAWWQIAVDNDRLLYNCHACKVTWPIPEDATACPVGHEIPEEDE